MALRRYVPGELRHVEARVTVGHRDDPALLRDDHPNDVRYQFRDVILPMLEVDGNGTAELLIPIAELDHWCDRLDQVRRELCGVRIPPPTTPTTLVVGGVPTIVDTNMGAARP